VKVEDPGTTRLRPADDLELSGERQLTVARSLAAAYRPDGLVADETLRLRGVGDGERGRSLVPERLPEVEIVVVHDEPVVWAGSMIAHYGHFLLDSVSRLWPLLPGGELAGVPAVFTTPIDAAVALEWLDAFGARRVDLPDEGAVRFPHMHVPEPAWRIDAWVAPEIRDIHLQVRRNLPVKAHPQRAVVWLSRSRLPKRRRIYDECLLEWVLSEHLTVFHPEAVSLADQIATIESADVVAGVLGSAFHTLLMVERQPECVYLCPSSDTTHSANHRFQDAYSAQAALLDTGSTFRYACEPSGVPSHRLPGRTRVSFPASHRVLIPEALKILAATALPALLDDPRAAALADPERTLKQSTPSLELETAAARVILDPLSADARIELGAAFRDRALTDCAAEQFMTAADLGTQQTPARGSLSRSR